MPVDGTIELVSNEQQPSSDLTQSNNGNDGRRTIMTDEVKIDVDRAQHLSPLIQNNNGNDRSLTSTGVRAQEKSTPITDLLENKVAKMLGALVCGWVLLVLVQGGMVGSLETKDCGFVTLLFFLVFFRCWRHYCPEAYRSFTDATQSLSADYLSIPNDIQQLAQQLALPSCYICRLFYCSSLVSAMTSVVLSVMRLASQDFGKKEVENKESRDFALKVFYGLTLAEALVLLFAEALSFPIRWNSVGLADGSGDDLEVGLRTRGNSVRLVNGPGDGLEVGQITRGNSVGLADGPGDGLEVGLITRGNSVGLADGPGDGPEDGLITTGNSVGLADGTGDSLEVGLITRGNSVGLGDGLRDGLEDGPVNQSNEYNGVAQMTLPANQSNDFNSKGPADSLPNLRQRRRQKVVIKLSMENKLKRVKALKAAASVDSIISTSIDGDKIVVEGYGIDSVALTTILRKKLGYADLISVTSDENKKEEKTEDKSVKPVVIPYQYAVHPVYPYQYTYHEVSQDPDMEDKSAEVM